MDEIEEDLNDAKTISNSSTPQTERSPSPIKNLTYSLKSEESTVSSINLDENPAKKKTMTDNEDDDEVETSDLAHLEPKLRNAWINMRKLDKVLNKICKKEKQVKKETLALMEKNRTELEMLRVTSDHKESKLETENTAHFLALTYVDLDDEIDKQNYAAGPATPLFKTQLPEMDDTDSIPDKFEYKKPETVKTDNKTNQTHKTESGRKNSETNSTKTKQSSKSGEKKEKNSNKNKPYKDFIKRNIQVNKN